MSGTGMIVVATLCWGLWGVLDKLALRGLHPAQTQAVSVAVGVVMLPGLWWLVPRGAGAAAAPPWRLDARGLGWSVAAAVVTWLASLSYLYALRDRGAGEVAGMTATYPMLTLLLGAALLGEPLTLRHAGGIALVIAGLVVLGR